MDSETVSEAETVTDSETVSETETVADSETVNETETVTDSETASEAETVADSETASEPETVADSETVSEPETVTDSETVSEAETVADSETVSETENAGLRLAMNRNAIKSANAPDMLSAVMPLTNSDEANDLFASPFDFSVDPYGLIESTQAIRYGGGTVEPGARVIFKHLGGEYDFSSKSDSLSVQNYGDTPVKVTVNVQYSGIQGFLLADSDDFASFDFGKESSVPVLCLAVTDNLGNRNVLNQDGETVLTVELPAFAEGSDVAYSFRIEGVCSPEPLDWVDVDVSGKLTVTWFMEPLYSQTAFAQSVATVSDTLKSEDVTPTQGAFTSEPDAISSTPEPSGEMTKLSDGEPSGEASEASDDEPSGEALEPSDDEPSDEMTKLSDDEPSDEMTKLSDDEPSGEASDEMSLN